MSDMLTIGTSALQAFQQALSVTSNNISNASTPGYSRQTVNLATGTPEAAGSGSMGTGVAVAGVNRFYSGLLNSQMWSASSAYSRLDAFTNNAQTLSNMFADTSTGLSASLQKFTNTIQAVADAPTSTAARQAMLGQATGLAQQLQTFDSHLGLLDSQVNTQLASEATAITGIAKNIASLNGQITLSQNTGQSPNALLDARDQQVAELAKHVKVTTVTQADGSLNVFVGSGQSLVLGDQSGSIVTQQDPYNLARTTLAYQAGASVVPLGNSLSGGVVGGLLDFRSQLLDPARNQLGQVAVGVASAVNAQQNAGMDANGALGTDLFSVGGVQVQTSAKNSGAATLAVTRTGVGALTASDYVLSYSAGAWSLRKADSGAAVTMSGSGTVADPFVADGMSIVTAGVPAAGDSFKLQPTAGAVAGMRVLITDPNLVAAASAIRTTTSSANTGSASISPGTVLNPADPALLTPVTIQFTDATHYTVNGGAATLYSSGSSISANGWQLAITGTPVAGDSFTVGPNSGGVGDNSNALAMAKVLGQGLLSGGKVSLNAAVTGFVGSIAVSTSQAQTSLAAQQTVFTDSTTAVSQVSGVNLDEEAANLVRYQQAYQAAAQIIKTTETLFNSLLQAFA
jgi:flagellar hook-associated protein 1